MEQYDCTKCKHFTVVQDMCYCRQNGMRMSKDPVINEEHHMGEECPYYRA